MKNSSSLKGVSLTLKQALAEIARCHRRLEIDRVYQMKNGKMRLVPVPYHQRRSIPDGISCRDDTIKLMDRCIRRLKGKQS